MRRLLSLFGSVALLAASQSYSFAQNTSVFAPEALDRQFDQELLQLQLQPRRQMISPADLAQYFGQELQVGADAPLVMENPLTSAAGVSQQFEPLIQQQPFDAPVVEAQVLLEVDGLPSEGTRVAAWVENFEDLRRSHLMGNRAATALLGEAFLDGRGVAVNIDEGTALLEEAVRAGVPRAFTIHGQFLLDRAGTDAAQRALALQLLQQGLDRGDANASLPLALNDIETGDSERAIERLAIGWQLGTGGVPRQAGAELSNFCGSELYVCEPLDVAVAVSREVRLSADQSVATFTDRHSEGYVPVFTRAVATFPLRKDDAPPPFKGIFGFGAEPTPSVDDDLRRFVGGLIERGEFFEAATRAMAENPNEKILLYVHGFNNSVEDALTAIVRLKQDGELPGIPMIYSWAAGKDLIRFIDNNPLRPYEGYGHDTQIASSSCQEFRAFLVQLAQAVTPERIILFGHSHGAKLIHSALTDCEFRSEAASRFGGKFDSVVYAAPDIDRDQFLQSFTQLADVAKKVTFYASDKDTALATSGGVIRGGLQRLGTGGDVMTVVNGVDSVDASQLPGVGDDFGHGYAFLDDIVLADIKTTLEGAARHPCRGARPAGGFTLLGNCM